MKWKKYIAPFQKIEAGKNDTEAEVKEVEYNDGKTVHHVYSWSLIMQEIYR